MGRNAYTVRYREREHSEEKYVSVIAGSKEEAYSTAVYEVLDRLPYSAWVDNVTYQNGNVRYFNTHEGKPY